MEISAQVNSNEAENGRVQPPGPRMSGNIYLLGFMASGKTTVGQILSQELGWRFVDLDREIERRAGRTVMEIFRERSEAHFRALEADLLREIAAQDHTVVALGGGTYVDPANRALALGSGLCVFLDAPIEELIGRLDDHEGRPLAHRSPEELRELLESRRPSYAQSDLRVCATGSPEDVVETILDRLREKQGGGR